MSILGRGSMRDKAKEEELRNGEDPSYEHLKDSLHILVEAAAPFSNAKLGAGVAEVRKMLIPPVSLTLWFRAAYSSWPLAISRVVFYNDHPRFDYDCIKLYGWPIKILAWPAKPKALFLLWC